MAQVYLIRHCHPDIPPGVRMCLGRTDLPLSPTGHAEAAALGGQFRHIPLTHVFCSHLQRSIETAQALTAAPVILPGLEEMYAGQWDGLTFDEIQLRWPELYAARDLDSTLPLPDAEPEEQALKRFQRAMAQAAASADGDFAVVSHGGIISLFLKHLTGSRYKPNYGEVVHLQYVSGQFCSFP